MVTDSLNRYAENLYHSEGIAWALGLMRSDEPEIINFLQNQCRRCADYDAWWCAAHSLEQLNCGDAIEILKRTLKGPEWLNMDHCLEALGERPATIGILRTINRGNVDQVAKACIKALGTFSGRRLENVIWLLERLRLRDPEITSTLMALRENAAERGSSISHRVVEALAGMGVPAAREILEHDLQHAHYFRTRALAAKGLGLIGDPISLPVLEFSMNNENDGHVLRAITESVDEIRNPERMRRNKVIANAGWLENGMIIDDTNKWYWAPDIYDRFSRAEDPESVCFKLALSSLPTNIDTLVDLGAGTGRFLSEVLKSGRSVKRVIAIDRSKEMIEFLKRRMSSERRKVEILEGELQAIPLADDTADVVVSSWGFPSRTWDAAQSRKELSEVLRILRDGGIFVTIGWDESFNDEMTEIWYRFVLEPDCYFDSLPDYRRRKRSKIQSPRNCGLTLMKEGLSAPVRFNNVDDAATVFGHLFGYTAGAWVLRNERREFQMGVSLTRDSKESLKLVVAE